MTTEQIKIEMTKAGLPFTGMYSKMPQVIKNGVDMTNELGYDFWLTQTTTGVKVKELVKALSN